MATKFKKRSIIGFCITKMLESNIPNIDKTINYRDTKNFQFLKEMWFKYVKRSDILSYKNNNKFCSLLRGYNKITNTVDEQVVKDIIQIQKTNNKVIKQYKDFYKSIEWINVRKLILQKYTRKCMKCGKVDGEMHVDHIIPRSIDISKELDINNLQILCKQCNKQKSNKNCIDYRPFIIYYYYIVTNNKTSKVVNSGITDNIKKDVLLKSNESFTFGKTSLNYEGSIKMLKFLLKKKV